MSLFNTIDMMRLAERHDRHHAKRNRDQADYWRIERHLPVGDPLPPRQGPNR